mmetsp:Transcript_7131/g.24705  ORF Transcript_7131/g.24705 Transcript_7131/m.24705 type:complete len:120 (-) Transcript_7131:381-740(-)
MTAAKTVIIRQDEIFQTAVARGELEKVKEMIAHGAVVNCKNQFHVTPLHLAAAEDLIDVMEVLLANGAAVDARALDSSTPVGTPCPRTPPLAPPSLNPELFRSYTTRPARTARRRRSSS